MQIDMQEIDFLPEHYRQRREKRQRKPWQIAVVVLFLLLLGAAAYGQHRTRRRIEQDLAEVVPYYEMAVRETQWLGALQQQLQREQSRAALLTYLRHPWPRTQILAAILEPLPDEITLESLHISRRLPPGQAASRRQVLEKRESESDDQQSLPPAARDLKGLREEDDRRETVVAVAGVSSSSEAPYAYFERLENSDLFVQVDPGKVEPQQGGRLQEHRFDLTLIVRAGYGTPGGPTRRDK
jgi:hypothetical protein